ncbi:MAG TPA: fatty acid desaturase [Solirubrobacterales bacterium]|nr:fatty acid desaturase [Solirubrobacterales bacterium]
MAISDVREYTHLTDEEVEQIGRELDAIRAEIEESRGASDAAYINRIITIQRSLAAAGRVALFASNKKPAWAAGAALLGLAKILENMEIGHNVMHGQWDWMNDPRIHSSTWDWDTASTAEAWKHSHNYVHHTYTNIRGKDKDLGYEIMRIDPAQRWNPVYLAQPVYNLILMALFEWGVALHDLDFEAIRKGHKPMHQVKRELKGIAGKAKDQVVKDYIAWPLVSALAAGAVEVVVQARRQPRRRRGLLGRARRAFANQGFGKAPGRDRSRVRPVAAAAIESAAETFRATAKADATANIVRNVWAYAIIFCGHFPDQTYTFSQQEVEDESRGGWYIRQLTGSANIEGSPLFHVASGNLGYQVEHHLFPDMPSTRYAEIAPQVKDLCERYGLPYNSGPFMQQLGMVQRTILRLAFPGGRPRPKPGPYRGENGAG